MTNTAHAKLASNLADVLTLASVDDTGHFWGLPAIATALGVDLDSAERLAEAHGDELFRYASPHHSAPESPEEALVRAAPRECLFSARQFVALMLMGNSVPSRVLRATALDALKSMAPADLTASLNAAMEAETGTP